MSYADVDDIFTTGDWEEGSYDEEMVAWRHHCNLFSDKDCLWALVSKWRHALRCSEINFLAGLECKNQGLSLNQQSKKNLLCAYTIEDVLQTKIQRLPMKDVGA